MSKAFILQNEEWEFCREKGVFCLFAVEGQTGCANCTNREVLARQSQAASSKPDETD